MGEVYRARDTQLKREVAIKVLPEAFAQDADRLARFQREAELLATLNHPNIASVYGLEKSDGVTGIVLELIEGETLADLIARGPIAVNETLPITRQIADAFEAAHEKGVIHRDLKPANIKIRWDGQVKVLDFGLAKMLEPEAAKSSLTMSPTLSVHATYAGVILGTAAYMSPEQARGKAVDKRADIWAFGVVVFEMLTSQPLFGGETITDVIAAVVSREPEWTVLPASTPNRLRELLRRCLTKDPKTRLRDIGEARIQIEALLSDAPDETVVVARPAMPRRRIIAAASVALVAGLVIAAIATWALTRPLPPPAPRPVRFTVAPIGALPIATAGPFRDLALSPDGTHLVYITGTSATNNELWVRALDQLDAVQLRGLTNPQFPFISPDSKWIGFISGGELRKVSMMGGPPVSICRTQGAPRGASWGPDDTIVFATNSPSVGLFSVPAGGGDPKALTTPDPKQGEASHVFPFVLPGGQAVLFTITTASGVDNAQVAVLDLKTGQRKTLIRGGSQAQFVDPWTGSEQAGSSGSGHVGYLVYAAAGTLRAVRFDRTTLEVLSDPVPVLEQVMTKASGTVEFSLSRQGALSYMPGGVGVLAGAQRSLVWVNRQGREEPIKAPPRTYNSARLSPDGTRVAVDIRDQEYDIWIWDLARETLTRLTLDPGADDSPVWTPDGRRILFRSSRGGSAANLFWQLADGTGAVERLTTSPYNQYPKSASPDGKSLVLAEQRPGTREDLMLLALDGKQQTQPLLQTTFNENNGDISPDGRWLAYESDESGRMEVYVRPFPNVDGGRWPISAVGGSRPLWARSGRDLFFVDANGFLMAVPIIQTMPSFRPGKAVKVFDTLYFLGSARAYDVSRDGQRFLMIKDNAPSADPKPAPTVSMVVVLNWLEELKARLPTK
jgi:eukaryotic-like serine/threonine-protein kinase